MEGVSFPTLQLAKAYTDQHGGGGGSVTVDSQLDETSKNPVQNKVIAKKVNELDNDISEQKNAIDQKETKTTYTTLSGTTVTQTGEDHVMYLCGELATLSFTAPVSGITAIRFSSGTTATVVTLTGITMPDDWEGAEANKTYEINVLDGKGVYASWS